MSPDDRKMIVIGDIRDYEFGWPVGLPLCRPMAGARGLWEIRSDLAGGRIARVLFAVVGERMVLLHGFIKKTRKTPDRELALAIRRMKELRRHDHE
jgi:phage-related protein